MTFQGNKINLVRILPLLLLGFLNVGDSDGTNKHITEQEMNITF
jgi:hypothetical protein